MWYFNKKHYLYTLPSGCCTVRELMGIKQDGKWRYALVQYVDGKYSLICEFEEGSIIPQ